MSNVEGLVNYLIGHTGYSPDEVRWEFAEGFAFGINIFHKETGKRLTHIHASFPMTDDPEILAREMQKMFEEADKGETELVIDIDEGITDKNFMEYLDNEAVREWLVGKPRDELPNMNGVVFVPDGSFVTMDYRPERVRMYYNPDTNKITGIRRG